MSAPGDEARHAATRALAAGAGDDPLVQKEGKVGEALAVTTPEGEASGWIVPVTVGETLAGFFQFDRRLQMLRYSSTLRRRGSVAGAPMFRAWFDPQHVAKLAMGLGSGSRVVDPPRLTYDGNPTRIAWMVGLEDSDGQRTVVYVAGEHVYRLKD